MLQSLVNSSCEWEQEVNPRGELFYVESSFPDSRYESSNNTSEKNTSKETQISRRNHLGAKGFLCFSKYMFEITF